MIKFDFDELIIEKKVLIKKVSFFVYNNSISVIDGKNGVGKTLLLKRIFYDLRNKDMSVVYVEQDNSFLISEKSVLQNIAMNNADAESLKTCEQFIVNLGMAHILNHPIAELSGGEKRLICILRAIFNSKEEGVILLDEPTNDLSIDNTNLILDLLSKLSKNRTIIIATHDDRIHNISDYAILIRNHTIITKQFSDIKESPRYKTRNEMNSYNEKFIKECFINNVVTSLLYIIIVFFSLLLVANSFSEFKTARLSLLDNQIDIFTVDSIKGSDVAFDGAIPISAISIIDNNMSIGEKIQLLKESISNSNTSPINYDLIFPKSQIYDSYILEFKNIENKEYIDVLDRYRASIKNQENIEVETTPYFLEPNLINEQNKIKIKFDKRLYSKIINGIISDDNKKLLTTYITISLKNGETLEDFASSDELKNILNGNYYIYSNEIASLYIQLMNFNAQKRCFVYVLLIAFISVIIDFFSFYIVMKRNKNAIKVLYNIGASKKQINQILHRKYNNRFIIIVSSLILISIISLLSNHFKVLFSLSNYIIVVVVCSALLIMNYGRHQVIKYELNRFLNWRDR